MKIDDISFFELSAPWQATPHPARQAKAADIYTQLDPPLPAGQGDGRIYALYVEILTDEGVSGIFGPIERDQAFLIVQHLRSILIGRDPLASELLFDLMLRHHRHGRSGLLMTAISALDCALWDLKGKAWNQPVYRLLGGPTRPSVPAYASMLGNSIEPDEAAAAAADMKAQGYTAQKWFFRYGPGDGAAGMAKNIAMAEAVREAVGPHYALMFDAYMGWSVSYAAQMLDALEAVQPTWMEEPIPPERVSEFRRLRQGTSVPLATGEHIYTRWQAKELLVNEAVDVLQNDPDWTGGITELVKIIALASAFEVPVVAHGHSLLAALHIAGAQSPAAVPYVEFLLRHQAHKQHFHTVFYEPQNGRVTLPTLPGLGMVIDEAKVETRQTMTF